MSKSKSKQEEALQFLDDLDSLSPGPPSAAPGTATGSTPGNNEGEAEVLAFLDEITQKSAEPTLRTPHPNLDRPNSRAGTPTLRKSTERVRVGTPSPLLSSAGSVSASAKSATSSASTGSGDKGKVTPTPSVPQTAASTSGGWGWGNVWTTASAALQQARSAVDEQVKNLPNNEQARKWSEGVLEYAKTAQLDKLGKDFRQLGLSTLTDILNVVAPPISEHEVIQVWLSHDMRGYDGIESLVYRALTRIMEQVEGGDLIVNRGDESKPKDTDGYSRDLNAVDGYDAALKLAQANLDVLIKANANKPTMSKPSSTQTPTTYSHVYLRVQPFFLSHTPSTTALDGAIVTAHPKQLQFMLHLSDPAHQLVNTTVTQAVPKHWLELWDQYDWVEDLVAEALRVGVEVIGQEYVVRRMGWTQQKEPIQANEDEGESKGLGEVNEKAEP